MVRIKARVIQPIHAGDGDMHAYPPPINVAPVPVYLHFHKTLFRTYPAKVEKEQGPCMITCGDIVRHVIEKGRRALNQGEEGHGLSFAYFRRHPIWCVLNDDTIGW